MLKNKINQKQRNDIKHHLDHYQDLIYELGDYDIHPFDSDITADNIMRRAKEKLIDNIDNTELLDIELDNAQFERQKQEFINYIEEF